MLISSLHEARKIILGIKQCATYFERLSLQNSFTDWVRQALLLVQEVAACYAHAIFVVKSESNHLKKLKSLLLFLLSMQNNTIISMITK